MAATWSHPRFGSFVFDDFWWSTRITAPAFACFTYDPWPDNPKQYDGTNELMLHVKADDSKNPPPPAPAVLDVVTRVIERQSLLVPAVLDALWRDFYGLPPHSGMWWHGDLAEITATMDPDFELPDSPEALQAWDKHVSSRPLPDSPEVLYAWLRLASISGTESGPGYRRPMVQLKFDTAIDEEHGIGVLTDGISVLGIGYGDDASPFDELLDDVS